MQWGHQREAKRGENGCRGRAWRKVSEIRSKWQMECRDEGRNKEEIKGERVLMGGESE